jgi:O-acetyl-ADP-ribose deacetylase (regulator of RNase III)/RimJ/RimL family protein N-acetyltransferase
MAQIEIILGDIIKLKVDAIVNAANHSLLGGGGVDGAIHRAAGPELLKECQSLNGCDTGEAKITQGYNLPAKFVIHTVGPVWNGGNHKESELLSSCYRQSLKIALVKNLKTIAFPNISTGVYHFPKHEAASIAIESVMDFIKHHSQVEKIIFCCFDQENYNIYKQIQEKYIDFHPVQSADEIRIVTRLAHEIWNEHYVPIIGQDQVSYMVEKFQSAEAITSQIKEDDFEYYIINHSFEPCGYIGIKLSGDELLLSKFYIVNSKRGKGIGRKGIEFILIRAKELGARNISLTVNKENTNSIKAYEQMGFMNLGPIVTDIGDGFIMDDYMMKYFIPIKLTGNIK